MSTLPHGLTFRDPQPDDIRLVLDAWCKGFRESPWAGTVPNNLWHEIQSQTVTQLLARGSKLVILASEARPDQIVGFVCWEAVKGGLAIHWLYVKDPFRRKGLGSALLQEAQERHGAQEGSGDSSEFEHFYTHRTESSRWFSRVRHGRWRHAPEIARRK